MITLIAALRSEAQLVHGERRALLLRAADRITELEAALAWRPIETAPERKNVLVTYLNSLGNRRIVIGCYFQPLLHEDCKPYDGCVEINEGEWLAPLGWYEMTECDDDRPILPVDMPPTHWRPLDPPPGEE